MIESSDPINIEYYDRYCKDVGAVIVTFHPNFQHLKNLISTLSQQVDIVVVVDNTGYSSDQLSELLGNPDGRVKLSSLGSNLGVAEAQNVGINVVREENCKHVVLFDQDSCPPENLVKVLSKRLHQLIESGFKVAAVGPGTIDSRTFEYDKFTRSKNFHIELITPKHNDSDPIECDFVISSGCLMPIAAINSVGLMEKNLFIDCVDIEWGFRAMSKGYKIYGIPDAKMIHTIGDHHLRVFRARLTMHSPLRHYYFYRNFYSLLYRAYVPAAWKVHVLVRSTIQAGIFLLFAPNGVKHFSLILKGILHGLVGRLGKYE